MKLDLVKENKKYYSAKSEPEIIELSECQYIILDGSGDPNDNEFKSKVSSLYCLAYRIKKICKTLNKDFVVPKLEGLWWSKKSSSQDIESRKKWQWKILIRLPEYVSEKIFSLAQSDLIKKDQLFSKDYKFEKLTEGKCANIMHFGPYSTEAKTIEKLHQFISSKGYLRSGFHHEIYLSDPRKTSPQKMKTILRQPIVPSLK